MDAEFVEALYQDEKSSLSHYRQAQRKTWQFCRQVERALNLALAETNSSDEIAGIVVDQVSPAPDCGRLLVHVLIPADRPVADAIDALCRETPRLRSEVASAITRKRAPELVFVPAIPEGGAYE